MTLCNILTVTAICICFIVSTSKAYKAEEVFESLSDEDKRHFLRYYLLKGLTMLSTRDSISFPGMNFPSGVQIPDDFIETFEQLNIEPSSFPVKLLNNFQKKYKLSRYEATYALMGKCSCYPPEKYICIPHTGQCIDIGDVGSVCCT